jgi:hypothetical protein
VGILYCGLGNADRVRNFYTYLFYGQASLMLPALEHYIIAAASPAADEFNGANIRGWAQACRLATFCNVKVSIPPIHLHGPNDIIDPR